MYACCQGYPRLDWTISRRLAQLRELHDYVKENLGEAYKLEFEGSPFARRGGLIGTTTRLSEWCTALGDCINGGGASPMLAHFVLTFVQAPEPAQPRLQSQSLFIASCCFVGLSETQRVYRLMLCVISYVRSGRRAEL